MDLDSLEIERKALEYNIEYYEQLKGCFAKDASGCGLPDSQIKDGVDIIDAMLSALYEKRQNLEKRVAAALDTAEEMFEFMDSDREKKVHSYLY